MMAARTLALAKPAVKAPAPPCPVCGVAAFTDWTCKGCHVAMHEPCYWRTVPMSVWHEYLVALADPADSPDYPPVRCAACRQLDGLGKGGA